jgi:hypothetical protein
MIECEKGKHRLEPFPNLRNYFRCRICKIPVHKNAIEGARDGSKMY